MTLPEFTGRLSVSLAHLAEQRERGWPDFHPEDFCHRCGGRNLSWWTEPESWNAIMRQDGPDAPWQWNEIICPQCFAELWEMFYPGTSWHLWFDPETRGGQHFNSAYLFEEPQVSEPVVPE